MITAALLMSMPLDNCEKLQVSQTRNFPKLEPIIFLFTSGRVTLGFVYNEGIGIHALAGQLVSLCIHATADRI